MTLEELTRWLGGYPAWVGGALLLPAVLSGVMRPIHGVQGGSLAPWRHIYGVLIYWTCVPGMFMAMLLAYLVLFRNADLLKVDLVVQVLPVLAMILTLVLIRRNVRSFEDVPGFDRLSGLMVLLGVSFALAFVLHRLHIGIVFIGDFGNLILVALVVFALLKWGLGRLAGGGGEPPRPNLPP